MTSPACPAETTIYRIFSIGKSHGSMNGKSFGNLPSAKDFCEPHLVWGSCWGAGAQISKKHIRSSMPTNSTQQKTEHTMSSGRLVSYDTVPICPKMGNLNEHLMVDHVLSLSFPKLSLSIATPKVLLRLRENSFPKPS